MRGSSMSINDVNARGGGQGFCNESTAEPYYIKVKTISNLRDVIYRRPRPPSWIKRLFNDKISIQNERKKRKNIFLLLSKNKFINYYFYKVCFFLIVVLLPQSCAICASNSQQTLIDFYFWDWIQSSKLQSSELQGSELLS